MNVQRGLQYLKAEDNPLELPAVLGIKNFSHSYAKSI